MDSVRFGRALGRGARAAAKGLYEAVDAAASPNPNPSRPASQTASKPPADTVRQAVGTVAQGAAAYGRQKKAVVGEAGRLGRSLLAPFARAGKALWLEVTGTFYALFTLFFVNYTWRMHGAAHRTATNASDHQHFFGAVAAAAVFLYFTVTAFLRARRVSMPRR